GGGGHQRVDDGGVDVLDRRRALVDVVERGGAGHKRCRRMAAGAQEPHGDASDGVGGGRRQQLGAGGAEAHGDDSGRSRHPVGVLVRDGDVWKPGGRIWWPVASQVPYSGATVTVPATPVCRSWFMAGAAWPATS